MVLPPGLLMIHDSSGGSEHDIPKLSRWQKVVGPLFNISNPTISNLGEMTPHLFRRPVRLTTILPALWSSTHSNSPMYPCFIITVKNLTMTLELGRMRTCLLHRFSALLMLLRASANTFMRTIFVVF